MMREAYARFCDERRRICRAACEDVTASASRDRITDQLQACADSYFEKERCEWESLYESWEREEHQRLNATLTAWKLKRREVAAEHVKAKVSEAATVRFEDWKTQHSAETEETIQALFAAADDA